MGAEYIRSDPIPTAVQAPQGRVTTFTIQNIYAAETIGNILSINLKQKTGSELLWATFTQEDPT